MLTRETTTVETDIQRRRISSTIRERPKTCRFQLDRNKYYEADTNSHDNSVDTRIQDSPVEETKDNEADDADNRRSETPKLPKIVAQVRRRFLMTQFLTNTTRSIERRRRQDCPWMRGNEMQHFYSVWQQPLTTPKERMKRPIRRVQSLFKDFRYADEKTNNPCHRHDDFGIVRPCCSKLRSRIKMPGDPL